MSAYLCLGTPGHVPVRTHAHVYMCTLCMHASLYAPPIYICTCLSLCALPSPQAAALEGELERSKKRSAKDRKDHDALAELVAVHSDVFVDVQRKLASGEAKTKTLEVQFNNMYDELGGKMSDLDAKLTKVRVRVRVGMRGGQPLAGWPIKLCRKGVQRGVTVTLCTEGCWLACSRWLHRPDRKLQPRARVSTALCRLSVAVQGVPPGHARHPAGMLPA